MQHFPPPMWQINLLLLLLWIPLFPLWSSELKEAVYRDPLDWYGDTYLWCYDHLRWVDILVDLLKAMIWMYLRRFQHMEKHSYDSFSIHPTFNTMYIYRSTLKSQLSNLICSRNLFSFWNVWQLSLVTREDRAALPRRYWTAHLWPVTMEVLEAM